MRLVTVDWSQGLLVCVSAGRRLAATCLPKRLACNMTRNVSYNRKLQDHTHTHTPFLTLVMFFSSSNCIFFHHFFEKCCIYIFVTLLNVMSFVWIPLTDLYACIRIAFYSRKWTHLTFEISQRTINQPGHTGIRFENLFSNKYEDLTANEILKNYGDVDSFKLENLIDPPNEDGEMPIIRPSLHFSLSKMPNE